MSEHAAPVAAPSARPASLVGLCAAGRALPVSLLAALPGLVYFAGVDHLAYGLGLLAGVVLAGALVAPRLAAAGATGLVEALNCRFGSAPAALAAVVVVLVIIPILAAEFAFAGLLAEASLSVPHDAAIAGALVLASAAAVLMGDGIFRLLGSAAYVLVAASFVVLLGALVAHASGVAADVANGPVLIAIGRLEDKLLESGLVDFDTFSLHLTPFLRLSGLGLVALVVTLALGTAVLAPLLSALAIGGRPAMTRSTGAWTALFVMLVFVVVPALAVYAKLEIYEAIADGTPLAELPAWLDAPLGAGLAHIHGTSVAMLDEVARAVPDAGSDPAAIAGAIGMRSLAMEGRWLALDGAVQQAVIEAARTLGAANSPESLRQAFIVTVLPAAAAAAGNDAAVLSQAALVIEPLGLFLMLPALAGAPAWLAAVVSMAMLSATLAMAAALIRSLLSVAREMGSSAPPWPLPGLLVAITAACIAAGVALLRPDDLYGIVVASLSLGAAGLFPSLAVGLAWKRATTAGAVAAIVTGATVALYYDVGIQAFPVSFYETWAPLSNAGEFAIENFRALETDAVDAENEAARTKALGSLEALARGAPGRPGLANWAGIDSASGAIFGVPLGLLALVLVSLMTGRRSRR